MSSVLRTGLVWRCEHDVGAENVVLRATQRPLLRRKLLQLFCQLCQQPSSVLLDALEPLAKLRLDHYIAFPRARRRRILSLAFKNCLSPAVGAVSEYHHAGANDAGSNCLD